jgi:hypothetical protein
MVVSARYCAGDGNVVDPEKSLTMVSLTAALFLVVMALETLNVGPKWHSSMTT